MQDSQTPSVTKDVLELLEILKPKPSPYQLKRIGGKRDGAYLVPDDLEGIEACFSPGVNNTKNFEDELVDLYGIKCHMCDFSSSEEQFKTPLRQKEQTFRKKWLDIDGGSDSVSLPEWIEELAPDAGRDLLLQIDIEGAEYRNILNCEDSVLKRFRIIVLELHGLDILTDSAQAEKEMAPFLRKLDNYFICVHAHPNNCCGEVELHGTGFNIPKVHELTFLRRDRFERAQGSILYLPRIPHPLDISWNVPNKPPIFLSEAWCCSGRRTLASKVAMARSRLDNFAAKSMRSIWQVVKSLRGMSA